MNSIKSFVLVSLLLIAIPGFPGEEKKDCRDIPVVQLQTLTGEHFEKSEQFTVQLNTEIRRLFAEVEGTITSVRVKPGDIVTENWAVVEINNALKDEIASAEANIKKWERILWKREHWAERSERAERQARENIAKYKEEREQLKENSLKYVIRTDMAGAMESILVSPGDTVSPGTPVATVTNNRRLLFSISLPPEDQEYIQTGQTLTVSLKNNPDTLFDAKITRIEKDKVHFYISNESEEIPTDAEIHLKIQTRKMDNAIFIPSHLVLSDMQNHYVYIPEYYEESIQARRQSVVIGEPMGERIWVQSGLESGDTVIRTGLRCLEDGKTIRLLVKDAKSGKLKLVRNGRQMEKISLRRIPSKPMEEVQKTETEREKEVQIKEKPEKEFPREKTPKIPSEELGIRIDAGLGFVFARNPEIDEIATYFDTMDSSSEITAASTFTQPVIGIFYRFTEKLSAGLEGRLLFRSHDLNNSFSEDIQGGTIAGSYDYDPFEFKENYTIIMGKVNYALLQKPSYTIELDGGLGIYMGNLEKTKELSFDLTQGSTSLYSFDYEESLSASTTGMFGSIGGNFRIRLTDRISAFFSADLNYFFSSTWTGDYSYNLPEDTNTSGDLYFVTYNQDEKYLWVLDDDEVKELENSDEYMVESPDFLSIHLNFCLSIGINFRF